MAVTLKVEDLRSIHQVVVNLGLGRRPRKTSTGDIRKIFTNLPGVTVREAGGFKVHEGVWALSRPDLSFSKSELGTIRQFAAEVADKG